MTLYQGHSHPLGVIWPPHLTLLLKNVLKLHPCTHSPTDDAVGKPHVYSVLEALSDPRSTCRLANLVTMKSLWTYIKSLEGIRRVADLGSFPGDSESHLWGAGWWFDGQADSWS